MLSQRIANTVFAVLVILVSFYFAWIAEGFEASGLLASSGLPSKFFPQLILGTIIACAIITCYLYAFKGQAGGDAGETVFGTAGDARRGILMLIVSIASYLIWRNFGFLPMAILIGPLSLLAMGIKQPYIYATVWVLTGCVYLVFTFLLGIQLV
ncbi:MAG: tripartite tricarboxylate transporter TctB family protein [Paracoccaceae bacterium]|nr:tripartite tricarboxylate transporter TctB family protein [Paracoccaceae bacterium]MDE2739577.1 tripartite tricarboxylate transporter TctB family protein [Paracoccaceae bacterium]MDE2760395.1 tripartite tricarboxylate transporter TctB family protein [Paracoccaceae bacterium]MDE2918176.1 tripartite tricarboxylate transporter TctB family protein [Paracoccaceae bacterium]